MMQIKKNSPSKSVDIEKFSNNVSSNLPIDFINFYSESNGGEIISDISYVILWKIDDMIQLNIDYEVEKYAPNFFVFGTDGGNVAYSIEKKSGFIYEMDFIGMSNEDVIFLNETFLGFINNI